MTYICGDKIHTIIGDYKLRASTASSFNRKLQEIRRQRRESINQRNIPHLDDYKIGPDCQSEKHLYHNDDEAIPKLNYESQLPSTDLDAGPRMQSQRFDPSNKRIRTYTEKTLHTKKRTERTVQ